MAPKANVPNISEGSGTEVEFGLSATFAENVREENGWYLSAKNKSTVCEPALRVVV